MHSSVLIMMWHNLTQDALAIALHCPSHNHCLPSVYSFNKQFNMLKHPVKFHYFCTGCLQELIDSTVTEGPNPSCANWEVILYRVPY